MEENETQKKVFLHGLYILFNFLKRIFASFLILLKRNVLRAIEQLKA
jgi:hypothetical protein